MDTSDGLVLAGFVCLCVAAQLAAGLPALLAVVGVTLVAAGVLLIGRRKPEK